MNANYQNGAGSMAPDVVGPVQEEINIINGGLDSLGIAIDTLISHLEPVLGVPSPTESKNGLSNPSHCNLHARLMGITERILVSSVLLQDATRRLKL